MENDSYTEKVANRIVFSLEIFQVNDLWGYIPRSPASNKEILFLFGMGCESKVRNDTVKVILFPQYNIFRLKVPMHNFPIMHIFKSFQKSFHYSFYLGRSEFMFCLDFVV